MKHFYLYDVVDKKDDKYYFDVDIRSRQAARELKREWSDHGYDTKIVQKKYTLAEVKTVR